MSAIARQRRTPRGQQPGPSLSVVLPPELSAIMEAGALDVAAFAMLSGAKPATVRRWSSGQSWVKRPVAVLALLHMHLSAEGRVALQQQTPVLSPQAAHGLLLRLMTRLGLSDHKALAHVVGCAPATARRYLIGTGRVPLLIINILRALVLLPPDDREDILASGGPAAVREWCRARPWAAVGLADGADDKALLKAAKKARKHYIPLAVNGGPITSRRAYIAIGIIDAATGYQDPTVAVLDAAAAGRPAIPKRWCDVLGVKPSATMEEARAARRNRLRQCHPDLGGSHEEAVAVLQAFREALALLGAA